jgi:tetratricopeptide (TPR) repeat protein
MKRILGLVLALSCVAQSGNAAAQDDVEARARAHFAAGQVHVAGERFRQAYLAFSAGYELSQRPLFLFNMAECAYHIGLYARARTDYQRYLALDPNGAMAGTARERLEELGPTPPPPAESQVAPARVAAVAQTPPQISVDVAPRPSRDIWQEEAFWGVLGASVGLVLAAVITGVVVASTSNGPACAVGCTLVDFR